MGKHLISSDQSSVQIQENNPGCMWGMFQILDYHHWGVKKVFHHKKKRHARYKGKTILQDQQQYGVTEAEPLLVRQHGEKLNATGKSSPKNHRKEPPTEKRFNEEITTEGSLNHKHIETNKLNRDISIKFKKHSDVLEVISVEKNLLLKFLRDIDKGGKRFHQASHNKARFTKSGSFPLTASSHNISSSTFKHKQNKIWAFPKGEKLLVGTQAPKKFGPSLVKDISYEWPKPLESDPVVEQKPSISSRSSEGLNHKGWNQLVLHQFKVIKHKIKHALVEFKKSGHYTSVEAINNSASPEYSLTNNEKEISQSLDDGEIQEYKKSKSLNETKASDFDSNKHEVRLMRRTSSLNESLDRYTQLFEKSFSKEVKWQSSKSKSLRLTNEDKIHKSGHAPMFSRSNLSMPNLESLGFILHEALLDSNDVGNTVEIDNDDQRKSVSIPVKIDKSLDHFKETEIEETVEGSGRDVNPSSLSNDIVEKIDEDVTCDQIGDINEPTVGDESFPQEKVEISMTNYLSKEVITSLETSHQDNTNSHAEGDINEPTVGDESFPQEKVEISMTTYLSKEVITSLETSHQDNTNSHAAGRELKSRGSTLDELEADLHGGSVNSLQDSLSSTNVSVTGKDTNTSVAENDSKFKYVKDVLEFSGFMGNEEIQMQYTVDQPLKPSLFMALEASLRHENESSGEEIINPYDHQLLFNLVNEVLFEIYEKSPTYFPRPFSFNQSLHPMPKGQYLFKEVWSSVSSYMRLRPELDQTLDDVVGRDLGKRSGWMNIQQEEECVALELEEMIIDDLLDEIIFS